MVRAGAVGSFALQLKIVHTKQTIAIIGATGQMGTALSESLAKAGYRLLLFSGNQERLKALESKIRSIYNSAEVDCASCQHEACWEADIIIPAIPYHAQEATAATIRDVATQKVVISIINPFNKTFDGLETSNGTSAAEELQQLLPHSHVVKAFNTNTAAAFPVEGSKQQPESFIAGDDAIAVAEVAAIVVAIGFRPVIVGGLSASRALEEKALAMLMDADQQNNKSKQLNHE